jgi:hypothetical protein
MDQFFDASLISSQVQCSFLSSQVSQIEEKP